MSAEANLLTAPVSEIAAAMASGELSSERLLQSCLEQINRYDPALGVFTRIFVDSAVRQAHLLDDERRRGQVRGPLHGIPVVFKDLFEIQGRETGAGSRLFDGHVAEATATVVTRLEAAGMVTLGKTRMVELAFGVWGTNAVQGTPQNPWDATCHRVPGGSSSGAAVAVAAGFAPVAIGSDTSGSVRIPAALCGLTGLKTTEKKIPTDRLIPLSESLDTVGPITRCVTDAALVFDALTGESTAGKLSGALGGDSAVARIGVLGAADLDGVDADVLNAYQKAVDTFANLGADIQAFSFGRPFAEFAEKVGVLIGYEGWRNHGARIRTAPGRMDPRVLARFRVGEAITAGEYHVALLKRERAQAEFAPRMAEFDAVLTPTTPVTAVPVEDAGDGVLALNVLTGVVNYLGLCAVAVPSRLDTAGLPMSVQLIGAADTEGALLNLALGWERVRGTFPRPDLSGFDAP